MADIERIARAIDHIEDNLQAEVAVAGMAAVAAYSLFHFCRTFSRLTHHTPYDYLMRRRLAEAARELLSTERRIIDVAFDYGWRNPETFTRAFRRVLGTLPSRFRQGGRPPARGLMPRLTPAHLQHIQSGMVTPPALEETGALSLAGVMAPLRRDRSGVDELWALLARELGEAGGGGSRNHYGLLFEPVGPEAATRLYLAAADARGLDLARTALVTKDIPPLRCARFVHTAAPDALPLTLDYVYHTWLPKSGHSHTPPWVLERYGPQLPSPGQQGPEVTLLFPLG
jgi:AraC family transcriptional regulator